MTLYALDHVQLVIPAGEEDQARAFYGDVLGLAEVPKPAHLAARGGVWFEAGTLKFILASSRISDHLERHSRLCLSMIWPRSSSAANELPA